ncbi:MAG: glycosyltransferase family 4 protein [Opitutales bacterium]
MKLSLITETFPPEINGVAMTLHRVVEGLIDREHEVEVVCPRRPDRELFFPERRFGLRMVRGFPLPRYPELRFGLPAHHTLRSAWQANRPDLVHIATEGPLGWSAERVAHHLRIPAVTTFHTNFHTYTSAYGVGLLEGFAVWWMRRMRRRVRRTFVPSDELSAKLTLQGFQKLSILSRGVDTALFSPARRDPALRASWGADAETPVAIYVGRIAAEKNLPLTLRAWQAMRETQPDLRLVLVGDGPERARIAREHPEVLFAGPQRGEDLARHYASADIFLFGSTSETFGNVVTEAMASGLLVLGYDYAAARQLLRDGQSAALAPLGDESAYLHRARQLAADPAAWAPLRLAARATAENNSWEAVLDNFARELQTIALSKTPHAA